MKTTRINSIFEVVAQAGLLASAFFLMISASCSKGDDGGGTAIKVMAQTYTLNGTNNCNTSSGSGSTFVFEIPYTAGEGITISKLLIKTTVSNGESEEKVNTQFTNEENTIGWAVCFRFGSQDWVEYEVRLEAADGSRSNPSKVRVNRPGGAN